MHVLGLGTISYKHFHTPSARDRDTVPHGSVAAACRPVPQSAQSQSHVLEKRLLTTRLFMLSYCNCWDLWWLVMSEPCHQIVNWTEEILQWTMN